MKGVDPGGEEILPASSRGNPLAEEERKTMQVQDIREFPLESGDVLRNLRQSYYIDGTLSASRNNLVVVFHSLSATPNPSGDWWPRVVGPGRAINTDRYAVLSPSLLGSPYGTTSPVDLLPRPFPPVTLRDMVRLVRLLVEELGVDRVRLATGGSMGGMVALEWAATYPDLTGATVAFAAPARLSAAALGWNHVQQRAIEMGGSDGMRLARMVGMMLYRTPEEFEHRFGRRRRAGDLFEVSSYLDHQAGRLAERFHPASYLTLLRAIAQHDVGRDRGGVGSALRAVKGRLIGVGIPGDQLYPAEEVQDWVREAGSEYHEIRSMHGHDAFLLEPDPVGRILSDALEMDSQGAE